jgi:hypothetical protein
VNFEVIRGLELLNSKGSNESGQVRQDNTEPGYWSSTMKPDLGRVCYLRLFIVRQVFDVLLHELFAPAYLPFLADCLHEVNSSEYPNFLPKYKHFPLQRSV